MKETWEGGRGHPTHTKLLKTVILRGSGMESRYEENSNASKRGHRKQAHRNQLGRYTGVDGEENIKNMVYVRRTSPLLKLFFPRERNDSKARRQRD